MRLDVQAPAGVARGAVLGATRRGRSPPSPDRERPLAAEEFPAVCRMPASSPAPRPRTWLTSRTAFRSRRRPERAREDPGEPGDPKEARETYGSRERAIAPTRERGCAKRERGCAVNWRA